MTPDDSTWFSLSPLDVAAGVIPEEEEFRRIWLGFMTARVTLSLMLLLLQITLWRLSAGHDPWLIVLCGIQLIAALAVRIAPQPRRLGRSFDRYWLGTIGFDVVTVTLLQLAHGSAINYAPLLALPVLQSAVLGSLMLALGTAAGITLLLLASTAWLSSHGGGDLTSPLVQAGLTGAGSFVVALLTHQITARLAREQLRTRSSQGAMRLQQQVNDLVISTLTDGVLVVDVHGHVHAANPAARHMLERDDRALQAPPFQLSDEAGWQALAELALRAFTGRGGTRHEDVLVTHAGQAPRRLLARTQLTLARWGESDTLCVVFLQDQREIEARLRTEKLASMGRMSAAVAHEIRNPLAAIAQANDLLDEELHDPALKRLAQLVRQNAQRLDRIVDDVLNVSRAGHAPVAYDDQVIDLCRVVPDIVTEWEQASGHGLSPLCSLPAGRLTARFDPEHLRRVLVNLLDNARRHASRSPESVQVHLRHEPSTQEALLAVWSDGPPMDPSVEQHLFEPFFSSESRSSGLGLYICRQLCEGHGAAIGYHRARRIIGSTMADGNEFFVALRRPPQSSPTLTGMP